jgi:hypothetical protein
MGGNCSTCNCNRDEKESELKIEEKGREGSKLIYQNNGYDGQHLQMNDIVLLHFLSKFLLIKFIEHEKY